MNPSEAAQILAALAAAYRTEVDEQTAAMWFASALERCDYQVAQVTIGRIVAEDEWYPTLARFNGVRRSVERGSEPPHRALPSPPQSDSDRQRVKEIIEQTRSKLRGAKEAPA